MSNKTLKNRNVSNYTIYISTKAHKIFWYKLTKYIQDLHAENYKT